MKIRDYFINFLSWMAFIFPLALFLIVPFAIKSYSRGIGLFSIAFYSVIMTIIFIFLGFLLYLLMKIKFPRIENKDDGKFFLFIVFITYFTYFFFSNSIYEFLVKQIGYSSINSKPELYVIMIPFVSLAFIFVFRFLNYFEKQNKGKKIVELEKYLGSELISINKIKGVLGDLIVGIFIFSMVGILLSPAGNGLFSEANNLSSKIILYKNLLPIVFVFLEVVIWAYLVQFREEIKKKINSSKKRKAKERQKKDFFGRGFKKIKVSKSLKMLFNIFGILLFVILVVYSIFFMPKSVVKEIPINAHFVTINISNNTLEGNKILSKDQGLSEGNYYLKIIEKNNTISVLTGDDSKRDNWGILDYEDRGFINLNISSSKTNFYFNVKNTSRAYERAEKSIMKKSKTYVFPESEGKLIYLISEENINSYCSISYIDQSMSGLAHIYKWIIFEDKGEINTIIYVTIEDGALFYSDIFINISNKNLNKNIKETLSEFHPVYDFDNSSIKTNSYNQNYENSYRECLKYKDSQILKQNLISL